MPNYIEVSNLHNNTVWTKTLTEEEVPTVLGYFKGKSTVDITSALLKPVRTNNLQNFSKDFFLPTTINHAIKIEEVAKRVLAILVALILDIVTFPIRLITVIPRAISNTKQEENLLYKYLKAESVSDKLLESDYVRVNVGYEREGREQHSLEFNVNFIELPSYKDATYYKSKTNSL